MCIMKEKHKGYLLLLFIMLIAGCGRETKKDMKATSDDYTYLAEYQFVYMDSYVPYISIIGEDGTLYFAGYKQEAGTRLFSLKFGEKEAKEIPLGIHENMWISAMGKDHKGNILFACNRYNEKLEQLDIFKISDDGDILETLDLTNHFIDVLDFEVKNIVADVDGNYYIASEKSIYILNDVGVLLSELKAEYEIGDMIFTKDEDIIVVNFNNGQLDKVDINKKKLQPIKSNISFKYGIYEPGRDKDIIFSQGNMLYTCDLMDEEVTEILNWIDNDVDSKNIGNFTILEDGRIAAFSTQQAFQGDKSESEFIYLKKIKRSEVPEKKILTYGHCFYNSTTSAQILRFNKVSKEYRIEMKQYGDGQTDIETKRMLLQTDIISGKGPDIIDIGLLFSPDEHYEFVEMGILEDLSPYFEKDEEISREDYLENVLSVYEKDNKIYAVMPSFMVSFLVGKVSDIGKSDSWTMEEMIEFISYKPKNARILPNTSRSDILQLLLKLNMDEFINKKTGKCYFIEDKFKQLLQFVSCFPKEIEEYFYGIENVELIRDGDVLLLESGAISMMDFQTLTYMFDEPINCIGYPTNTGKGATADPCVSVIAMSKGSDHKQGAWEFIRFLLAKEQQIELGLSGMQGFPINKVALEHVFNKAMQAEYYEDKEGIIRERSRRKRQLTEELTIDFYAATDEEVVRAKYLIDSIGNNMDICSEQKIFEIIIEEAEAYFEGQKSVDEVADIIQKRVQIYVDEKN